MDTLENKVMCIDVENRPGYPLHEQLGHNTIINEDVKEINGASSVVARSFLMHSPTRRRDLPQKFAVSYMKMTIGQYFTTTIRKHHRCVEMAMNNADMLKAMHHIDQCIKLAPNNARFHIERAEIYAKLQDYQHAISDLHIALSLGSKSLEAK
ncbi:unnamed protein product [Trichobilharzia szidati]|nr:unnamed protein product [Trichobilharzia szidati]